MADNNDEGIKAVKELERLKLMQDTLDKADGKYAIKLVEKIVFGMVAMILVGAISALLALIFRKPSV